MHITIIQVGKTKTPPIEILTNYYQKLLSPYAKIKIITIKPATGTSITHEQSKEAEAKIILPLLNPTSFQIALDEHGKIITSNDFAKFIQQKQLSGVSNLTFIIGGAFGLSQLILKKSDLNLSFSAMTFTHQMIRPLLFEQLYRAFTIISGKTYHY